MKKYRVILHVDAERDIRASYEWGCRTWGEAKAREWVRELRKKISDRLSIHPESCPIAPESSELAEEIRQFIVGRYRVLFAVQGSKAYVLHIRGAFVGRSEEGDESPL